MTDLIAITQIHRAKAMNATGQMDGNGNPILRREVEIVPAGTRFHASPEEAADLVAAEAAVLAPEVPS